MKDIFKTIFGFFVVILIALVFYGPFYAVKEMGDNRWAWLYAASLLIIFTLIDLLGDIYKKCGCNDKKETGSFNELDDNNG